MTVTCVTLPCDGAVSVRVGEREVAVLPPLPLWEHNDNFYDKIRARDKWEKDRERWLHELEKAMTAVAQAAAEEVLAPLREPVGRHTHYYVIGAWPTE